MNHKNPCFIKLIALIILQGFFLFVGIAQAPLTAEQAVDIALQNNFGIRVARNETLIAAHNVTKANAGMLPEVNFVSGLGISNTNTNQEFANGTEQNRNFASSYNGNAGVQLSWTLYDGRRMYIAYDRLEAQRTHSEQLLQVQVEQTTAEVLLAWSGAVLQQSHLATLQKNIGFYDERLRIASLRAETGTTGKSPQLQAQVDKNLQKTAIQQAQNNLEQQKIALNRLLNRTPETTFTLPDSLPAVPELNLEVFIAAALNDNAMLRARSQELALANYQTQELQTLQRPRVELTGGYNYLRSQNQAGFLLFNQNYGLNAGVQLTWNLYNGKNTTRQIKNAKLQSLNAQLRIEELQMELRNNLAAAFAALENAKQITRLEQENVALSRQNLDIAQERFKLGGSDILPVKEAQKSYEDAQMRLLNALYSAKVEEVRLRALCGKW